MAVLGSKKKYNKDSKRINNCENCQSFMKHRGVSGKYGRCIQESMYDTRSDGTIVLETKRPAARFADDYCEKHSKEISNDTTSAI